MACLEEERKAFYDAIAEQLPLNRAGQPEDVAEGVIYLLRNHFSTGEILHVEGGHRLIYSNRIQIKKSYPLMLQGVIKERFLLSSEKNKHSLRLLEGVLVLFQRVKAFDIMFNN